jgi:hypothetical protein
MHIMRAEICFRNQKDLDAAASRLDEDFDVRKLDVGEVDPENDDMTEEMGDEHVWLEVSVLTDLGSDNFARQVDALVKPFGGVIACYTHRPDDTEV